LTPVPASYFHRNKALFGPNDHIQAGNWGRVVLGMGPGHPFYLREYVFERIREHEFSALPSRLRSAFGFPNIESAATYNPTENLYQVSPSDPEAVVHETDYSWVNTDVFNQFRTFDGVEACARHYWQGDERTPNTREVLTESDLIVHVRLNALPENGHGPQFVPPGP